MTDAAPLLRLRGVETTYGDGATAVRALAGVDLDVHAGELVAIMGPSGAGKSTLLAVAGGLEDATAGTVEALGHDLTRLDGAGRAGLRRRGLGYVFQDLNLVPVLTALENVALPLELDGSRSRDARALAVAALERVGLPHVGDRFPDELSGGEQQRVAIARAIVGTRRLILADEPTGALDSLRGEEVMALLRQLCDAGAGALVVTHDSGVAGWADRVVFVRDGLVIDETRAATLVLPSAEPGDELA